MSTVLGLYNYWIVILLMMIGFYTVISRGNLIKKIAGLNIFQTSVFLLYISIGNVQDGTTPIIAEGFTQYSNPLPHVLILTAIVVGVAPSWTLPILMYSRNTDTWKIFRPAIFFTRLPQRITV